MSVVSKVRRDAVYAVDAAAQENIESAFRLIKQLLALEEITAKHHKEQLSIGLWKWTEAPGMAPNAKYNIRYVSQGVKEADGATKVQHEHVWTRKSLAEKLMSRSWSDDRALRDFLDAYGVGCIVTKAEHGLLNVVEGEGWERYANAGIAVFDRQEQTWLDLSGDRPVPTGDSPTGRAIGLLAADELTELIRARASADVGSLLVDLNSRLWFADAVAVPSYKREGDGADYYRVYDAEIEERTPAVAYVHWTGRIDFRLGSEDLPPAFAQDERVRVLAKAPYGIGMTVTDQESRELAEQFLALALEKLREQSPV